MTNTDQETINFLITKVKYEKGNRRVKEVKMQEVLQYSLSKGRILNREDLMSLVSTRNIIYTAFLDELSGDCDLGDIVKISRVGRVSFLKTIPNNLAKDSLGAI